MKDKPKLNSKVGKTYPKPPKPKPKPKGRGLGVIDDDIFFPPL